LPASRRAIASLTLLKQARWQAARGWHGERERMMANSAANGAVRVLKRCVRAEASRFH